MSIVTDTSSQRRRPLDDPATAPDTCVLPLISGAGDRRVVVDWLTSRYDVVSPDEASDVLSEEVVDLCILDPVSFARHREMLLKHKEAQEPRILPYLLIRQEDTPLLNPDARQAIDDVVVTPISKRELGQRIESLLRLRTLSRELEEKNNQLEKKNQQLEYLIGAAAHDLRNPLNIAQGYAKQLDDTQPVTRIRRALDRMEHLVENLLTVNQSQQDVTDERLETIAFRDLVVECWEMVPTSDANIEIVADEEARLHVEPTLGYQLVENLFRNAIEHGDDSVTIRVGTLTDADGFYVEDDGPGIPEEKRAAVFDDGYSTNNGNGLGLSIVNRVADAHGWEIRVTDSDHGGARFEFTGEPIFDAETL